ncbi:GyrI-like domain-containing protein [Terriglobus roseus]|uniref:AraC family transcriptional regulator n=1 Tax=Terriglobus roseus TaxID=392734 RepID=A0A1H4KJA4_9BACT|nr:GyrI-like domain-containing protein [Terriglobus roseus]SEB58316.1 AraC family transcriptional regulator [Terriglobus roseus]
MSTTLPSPKFRDGAKRLLAGSLQTHTIAVAAESIPVQWGDFFALDVPEIHTASVTYGVVIRADDETMDYMCAIEVPSFDGVRSPHRETLPAARYVVFTIDGLEHIGEQWSAIYASWLPTSGYNLAKSPAFERYDDRYDPESETGPIELWVPVEPVS